MEVTLGKIAERPFFGQGIGRFEAECNNWQADYFKHHLREMDGPKGLAAGNTKYCFNEYLEIGSETGITGLLLLLFVLFSVSPVWKIPDFHGSLESFSFCRQNISILSPSFLPPAISGTTSITQDRHDNRKSCHPLSYLGAKYNRESRANTLEWG